MQGTRKEAWCKELIEGVVCLVTAASVANEAKTVLRHLLYISVSFGIRSELPVSGQWQTSFLAFHYECQSGKGHTPREWVVFTKKMPASDIYKGLVKTDFCWLILAGLVDYRNGGPTVIFILNISIASLLPLDVSVKFKTAPRPQLMKPLQGLIGSAPSGFMWLV